MLVPAAPPPAVAISVRLFRRVGGDGEFRVEDLQTGGQRVGQCDMDATRGRGHGELDADAGAGADMPYTVIVAADIGGVVDSFIDALDGKAVVCWREAEVQGGRSAGPADSRAVPGLLSAGPGEVLRPTGSRLSGGAA